MTDAEQHVEPVPVRVVSEREQGATVGTWVKESFAATDTVSRRLLPQEPQRHRAVVFVTGVAPGTVRFGSPGQMGSGLSGIPISGGTSFVVESQSEVWVAPDGTNAMTVGALDERYL